MKIGLDFGTTNSIISYFNKKENGVVSHRLGGVNRSNYIPSIVSIENDENILIGNDAKYVVDSDTTDTYTRFKILLEIEDKKSLQKNGYALKKPEEITEIYLDTLIRRFKEDNQIDKIDSLVLTVPEIWISNSLASRSKIKEILEKLNITPKLVSEPVSAGAYFLFNYKERKKRKFCGHILVFDYGGGTLDIALLDTKDDHVKVLERVGKGKDEVLTGSAGVAYDEKVLHSVCLERNGIKLSKNNNSYYTLLREFEKEKIAQSNKIDIMLSNYMQDNSLNTKPIFTLTYIDEMRKPILIDIFPSDLVKAFTTFNAEIESSLERIDSYCKKNRIDTTSSDIFRVIMVGGFSSFYLSQKTVRDFFDAKDNDTRFNSYFKAEDNALAISKGATLIAENLINIDETYPLTIELLMKEINRHEILVDAPFRMFSKGDSIDDHDPIYMDGFITKPGIITFKFDYEDGQNSFKYSVEKNMEALFPNYDKPNNKWRIGFSIDENSFIFVHIEDRNKNKEKIELGNLIHEFKNIIIRKT